MKLIGREELKAKLERGDDFKLVMTMDGHVYERMHIPGSLHFDSLAEATDQLSPDDEIVVYCSNPQCRDSIHAYLVLRGYGFERLYRYAGGLADWYDAGYPLEGSMVSESEPVTIRESAMMNLYSTVAYP